MSDSKPTPCQNLLHAESMIIALQELFDDDGSGRDLRLDNIAANGVSYILQHIASVMGEAFEAVIDLEKNNERPNLDVPSMFREDGNED